MATTKRKATNAQTVRASVLRSQPKASATTDKIAKAAMSREMLAAGLAAAAAAISTSPAARRKIQNAGLDAANTASRASHGVMSSASKLGSLIAEAVADAADRVKSATDDHPPTSKRGSKGKLMIKQSRAAMRQKSTSTAVAKLVAQVQTMVAESGTLEGFDADKWVSQWVDKSVPALGGKRPAELLHTSEGFEIVSSALARMQSGAYA